MNRYKLFGSVAAVSIALDQGTKIYARSALPGESIPVTVIDGYWDWILKYNTGSAFSLFSGGMLSRVFLSIVACIAIGVICWLVKSAKDKHRGLVIALGLMAGGALGNLIDRILFGKVTDFVLWHYHEHYWPVFNIADVALVVAVPLFLVSSMRAEKEAKAEREAEELAESKKASSGKKASTTKKKSATKKKKKKS